MNVPYICCVFSCRHLRCPRPTVTLWTSVFDNIKTTQTESEATRHTADILSLLFLIHSPISEARGAGAAASLIEEAISALHDA